MSRYSYFLVSLQLGGAWPSLKWEHSSWKRRLYGLYTFVILIMTFTCPLSCIIHIITSTTNLDELIENSFILLGLISFCFKFATVLEHRDDIVNSMELLDDEIFQPTCQEEIEIRKEFEDKKRWIEKCYGTVASVSTTVSCARYIWNIHNSILPFNGWYPFSEENNLEFAIVFTHQVITAIYAAFIMFGTDVMICVRMIECCGQLEVLKYSFRNILKLRDNWPRDMFDVEQKERVFLNNFAEQCNYIFSTIMFFQFSASALIICMATYVLTKLTTMSPDFMYVIAYLIVAFTQIYIICWYGNEIMLESSNFQDALNDIPWYSLSLKTRKDLIFIIGRFQRPVIFTGGPIVTLSLESYLEVIKFAYSTYSVLKQIT